MRPITHYRFLLISLLALTAASPSFAQAPHPLPPADTAIERRDKNSQLAHQQLLAKAKQGHIDLYFEGDSITRRWGATDYPAFLENFNKNFHGWNAANFAWGGDTTNNILWRLQNGELDNVHPKVVVLLAGTNNVGPRAGTDADAQNVANGIKTILDTLHQKAPDATLILTAIFPRNDNPAAMPTINAINKILATYADGKKIRFLNINPQLTDTDGKLLPGAMNPDNLHPTLKTYQLWADALKPLLTELLGPPAKEDLAPPPTGDPSAKPPASQPH
jgi:lysophospholipase L1-like esterase